MVYGRTIELVMDSELGGQHLVDQSSMGRSENYAVRNGMNGLNYVRQLRIYSFGGLGAKTSCMESPQCLIQQLLHHRAKYDAVSWV